MKKFSVAALAFIFILCACTREKDETPAFLGTWKLDRIVEEVYHPINTLLSSDVCVGKAGDSVTFNANGTVISYNDDGSTDEEEWEMMPGGKVRIEYETYKIMKLTDTEFYLREEEIDQALNEKWVYELYLKR